MPLALTMILPQTSTSRADHTLPHMGLTSFRGAKVRKSDVGIAKNYLSSEEITALNNLTEQYLVFAQGQAMRHIPMHMSDWIAKLDAFISIITINGRDILNDAGRISHELAMQKAEEEYDLFNQARIAVESEQPNDFDRFITQIPATRPKTRKSSQGTSEDDK